MDERERDKFRKREEREEAKRVVIPPCKNKKRRKELEADDIAWLMYYFGPDCGLVDPFTYEFTAQQRDMIGAMGEALRSGGDQAMAASRGEGKTSIFECLTLKYTLQGALSYSVLFAATGTLADNSLDTIKLALEENTLLAEDYPEVCTPVVALEGTPNRAHYQIASGKRHDTGKAFVDHHTKFSWCGQQIVFPHVPGSPSSGAMIATRGLDSAVRGLKKNRRRVQLVGIDDPDTEETVRSPIQAKKLEDRIERAIAGLGGQKVSLARVMLTTIQNRTCTSFRFTDPTQKPSWKGKRFRFMVTPPQDAAKWEEYVRLKQIDWRNDTEQAHEFYVANREAMELGCKVANPNRYVTGELSAIQHYYNLVAKLGEEAVATEYDNNPPETAGPQESGITEQHIASRLNGLDQMIIPSPKAALTIGVDIGKYWTHWVAVAFDENVAGYVVDYDAHHMKGKSPEDRVQLSDEDSIGDALRTLRDIWHSNRYVAIGGEVMFPQLVLIDSSSGLHQRAVYEFHRHVGRAIYMPAKGFARGGRTSPFHPGKHDPSKRIVGENWAKAKQVNSKDYGDIWLHEFDADYWKRWVHQRFLDPMLGDHNECRRGSLSLWQPEIVNHHKEYSRHIASKVWQESYDTTKGRKEGWAQKREEDHYLDATTMACVAASMCGVRIVGETRRRTYKSMAEMQASARAG